MPIEPIRKCGYRKVHGLYLCGSGMAVPCDLLPLEIIPCSVCGFQIPFTRGFMWLNKKYIEHHAENHHTALGAWGCKCTRLEGNINCPMCFPTSNDLERYGFMWVGSRYYTPDSFVKEAQEMGVSKRIAEIPKGLVLGKTWVLLAHPKVPFWTDQEKPSEWGPLRQREEKPAIFSTFQPKRVEMLIWQKDATPQRLEELMKKGITPIVVPDNEKEHA